MNTPSLLICSQLNNIFSIQFNRMEKKNAINIQMYNELTHALLEAENNNDVNVIVITGGDSCFTAGNDLLDFISSKKTEDLDPILNFIQLLPKLRKPLIAAVNGLAIGIGTTLLLHCDIVIADQNSRFQLPFIDLGICPEAASSLLLPRLVGHQKASELLFLGERFDANTAITLGMINEIVSAGAALPLAMEKAAIIAKKSPRAVQLTKTLLKQYFMNEINDAITKEAHSFYECLQTQESQLAIRAFLHQK